MPFEVEESFDFKGEDQYGESVEWADQERKEWEDTCTTEEKEAIDIIDEEEKKIVVEEYIRDIKFFHRCSIGTREWINRIL